MTKIIKEKDINSEVILEVSKALKEGKLVVFPTDTVYGIGTNAYDGEACERIYEVKGRPMYKPLVVLISDLEMLKDMVEEINEVEQKLIDTYWPGPLTIKFRKKKKVLPDIISAGDDYVRVRLMSNSLIYELIRKERVPVVAPSANLSGSLTGTKIQNIVNELGGKVDYILDCGDYDSDVASTIVEVEEGKVIVIREGKITKADIAKIAPIKD